jgi:hypothetical protein
MKNTFCAENISVFCQNIIVGNVFAVIVTDESIDSIYSSSINPEA